jgi:hypothetical protein
VTLTAIVLTRNEAAFIDGCLASLRAVTDDVLVLDALSTDGTPDLAVTSGARVVQRRWEGFAAARNTALELAGDSDWTLFVDADERMPPRLAAEIQDQIQHGPPEVDGYWIPRKNVICGRLMRGGGWWPDYQLRLLRPGRCEYPVNRAVHETAACAGPTLALNTPLIHLNYRTWREFARKQFDFAALATESAPYTRKRAFVGAPGRTFVRRFIGERGYLDGMHGIAAATLLSASELYRVWLARRRPS